MTEAPESLGLAAGFAASGMSPQELYLRQISVGGGSGSLEVEAYVLGLLVPDTYTHNVLAQAINEHFMDEGGDHPVAYLDE